jgi:hypothetical protein
MALVAASALSWIASWLSDPLTIRAQHLSGSRLLQRGLKGLSAEWLLTSGTIPPLTSGAWEALKSRALKSAAAIRFDGDWTCFDVRGLSQQRSHLYHAAQVLERLISIRLCV